MKKFTGRYTTNTAKALKGSERILCQVSEDGTIYICNGFLLCTMNAPEYAATVQPLTCCEPGAWTFDKDGKHEDEAHKLDLVKLFADTVRDTADAAPLARAPFTVQAKKAPAACYYNADADFAAIYDTKFIDALHPAAQLRTTSAISAALAYINESRSPWSCPSGPSRTPPAPSGHFSPRPPRPTPKPTRPTSSAPSWSRPRKKPPRFVAICTAPPTRSTS